MENVERDNVTVKYIEEEEISLEGKASTGSLLDFGYTLIRASLDGVENEEEKDFLKKSVISLIEEL